MLKFRSAEPDISLPASLRRFVRFSPWCLTALWTFALFILIICIIGDVRMKSIFRDKNHKSLASSARYVDMP